MRSLLIPLLTVLLFCGLGCKAQDANTVCNPYKLMQYFNNNDIKFRASNEETIGKSGVGYQSNARITANKTLTVIVPATGSNCTAYQFYQSTSQCTITAAGLMLGDKTVQCWATKSSDLAWGAVGEVTHVDNGNGTITYNVVMSNDSDCDPRICMLIVRYK